MRLKHAPRLSVAWVTPGNLGSMRRLAAVIGVAAAVVATGGTAQAGPPRTPVVPSLEPAATAKLWRELVAHPRTHAARQGACRPLRAIFYAQTDWLRLATKLAAQPSPCAQYYVSVPPLAAAKTTLRNGEAAKIRALGPNFHALAEINYSGWSQWVASNNATWFDAGVEARKRMEAAGFDVSKGDTWAVNELSSAVRVGTGAARQNARDLVRGLATGSGGTQVKGVAWTVGISQPVIDTTLYQTNLQNWMGDAAFWTDMAAYVSDWSQEVYPDWRKTAVPGSTAQQRRDYLNDYLQHELVLARVAPPAIEPARTYIQSTYAPLASAAWSWDTGYGWSAIPFDQMQSFVSLQVYALRAFSVSLGQPQDHWGFAWAPRNVGLSSADFTSQSAAILDRLAAAIRDSAAVSNPADPGIEACNGTCGGDGPGRVVHRALEVLPHVDPAAADLHDPAADDRGRRTVGADVARSAERDGRGAAGAGADRDHALVELAARSVLARADRAVDADARLLDPTGRERGRAVLLPRHARRKQHGHRCGRRGDERDAGRHRPPGRGDRR